MLKWKSEPCTNPQFNEFIIAFLFAMLRRKACASNDLTLKSVQMQTSAISAKFTKETSTLFSNVE
jgi:hypothetical protein